MRTFRRSFCCFLFLVFAGFGLQSCKTTQVASASPETPYVLSFDFQQPVQATQPEADRFAKALEYAVPEKSKILVGSEQVWPPRQTTLKTVRTVNGTVPRGDESHVTKTRGNGALAATERVRDTRSSGFENSFFRRPNSTQYIAFKSEADLRNFLRVLGGGTKLR